MKVSKHFILYILLFALLPLAALAETAWQTVPASVHPGQKQLFSYVSDGGMSSVSVTDAAGDTSYISFGTMVEPGETSFWWDGCINGAALPEGGCTLSVAVGSTEAIATVNISGSMPALELLDAPEETASDWEALVYASAAGTVSVSIRLEDGDHIIYSGAVDAGENLIPWNGRVNGSVPTPGAYDLTFRLTDTDGVPSPAELLEVIVPQSALPRPARDAWETHPNDHSEIICDHDPCYWKMVQGDLDEEAVWSVLTQPVTVLKGKQRDQIKIRKEPDEKCKEYVGEVTCDSQAVHILGSSSDGAWTLIEGYSSSENGGSVRIYADHFTGWVKTNLLQEKQVSQKYGIVIDKLQQRLYLFKEGKLFTTLLCSTGFSTPSTPFNETPAGEFLIVSWTGGFYSEEMYCDYALRINSGILLHEVPCYLRTRDDGSTYKYYSVFQDYLGEKASHGCIRIQVERSPQGVNAKWLWDNLERKPNVKVIIWDELDRFLLPADDDYVLYYNADKGNRYHSDPYCRAVNSKYHPLTPFTFGELNDAPYSKLTRCPACAPQLRPEDVEKIVNDKNVRTVGWK